MTIGKMNTPPLQISLFGPIQVLVNGVPLPHLRSRKALWLLALLILRAHRSVEREWLSGTLWPDIDQSQAFANLRTVVSELRQALGSEGHRLQSPGRKTLRLDLTDAEIDVITFDADIEGDDRTRLERAVGLYRGILLEGCSEEWATQERIAREQSCLLALHKLGGMALATAEYDTAIAYYQRAVNISPLDEVAQRGWMEALAKRGDINAALQVYRDFVEQLKVDPKATPDPKTTALYSQLRNDARQKATPASPVFEAPVLLVTGSLPYPLTELIGREEEQGEIIARLKRHRLVTLTGVGGIGKTRLAIEVATTIASDYPDGAWMIPLETITDDRLVINQVAAILDIREAAGRSLLQTVTDYLKRKRLLLVLDNCEHLREGSADIAGHLLRECIGIRILATSREALGITGEIVRSVPSLAVPDPDHLPDGTATLQRVLPGYESVQLFIERAQAVQKSFHLTGSNALPLARICYRLEGIPLAIELAAARVRALSVELIADRFQTDHGLLTGENRTAASRQQTLRGTLDWSYGLLNDSEKVLLSRLSVFVGGWTLEAAEGICSDETLGVSQITELLGSLVDKSLVVFSEEKLGERYRLLEMVRQYAFERLKENDQAEAIRSKHRDWFLKFARTTQEHLRSATPEIALQKQDREYDNLRAAIAWCEIEKSGAEIGLQLVETLWGFWCTRGYISEGRKHMTRALAREEAQARTPIRASVLSAAGALINMQGDYASARELIEESITIFRELEDGKGTAFALIRLGNLVYAQDDLVSAQGMFEESLRLFKEIGNQQWIAWSLNCLGNLMRCLNNYSQARVLLEEGLKIRRELGGRHSIASSLIPLALVVHNQEDLALAGVLYEECLGIFQELGDTAGTGVVLLSQGTLAYDKEDFASARELYEESLGLFKELGETLQIAWALNGLGDVTYALGDVASAEAFYREGLSLFRKLEHRLGVANNLCGLAALRKAEDAVRLWGAVYAFHKSIDRKPSPIQRRVYDRRLEEARAVLGEERFAASWEEGCALNLEQAVAEALK